MTERIHPADKNLLACLDGEASPSARAVIESHLTTCAECQTRFARFQAASSTYDRYRRYAQQPPLPVWPVLDLGAGEIKQTHHWFTQPLVRWAAALSICVLLAVVSFQFLRPKPPAMVFLLESAQRVPAAPNQMLRVTAAGHNWLRPAVFDASISGQAGQEHVANLFRQARYDWSEPLSARAFANWRNGLAGKQDDVTEIIESKSNSRLFRLRTKTSASNLRAASLTLRADTLHPFNATFEFVGEAAIGLSEELGTGPIRAAVPRQIPPAIATPETKTEKPATAEDELRVFAALASLDADTGEAISVDFDSSRTHVIVGGIGIAPSRQLQLERAVSKIPAAVTSFQASPSKALTKSESSATPTVAPDPAFNKVLQDLAGGAAQLQEITDQALETSSSTLTHAYALGTLAQKFPADVEAQFSAVDSELLRSLRQRHMAMLTNNVRRLNVSLKPLLRALSASAYATPVELYNSWQGEAVELLDAARSFDQLLNQLLSGTVGQSSLPDLTGKLGAQLERLSALTSQ